MELDEETIKKFKDAYLKEFGETITDKEASEKFFGLVNLLRTIIYGASDQDPEENSTGLSFIDESESNANLND
jgi:hypothetical protein